MPLEKSGFGFVLPRNSKTRNGATVVARRFNHPTERWIREGRGQGHCAGYRPWLSVQQVRSCGQAQKIFGLKTGRFHHVLSDLEATCLTALEFHNDVVDIREQFPLLPGEITQWAASTLGIRHPRYPRTTVPCVLTSDFCADVRSDQCDLHETSIAVKYSTDLTDPRIRELLAIEREANLMQERKWSLFTEQTLPQALVRNLKWLRRRALPRQSIDTELVLVFCRRLLDTHRTDMPLDTLLNVVCSNLDLKGIAGVTLFSVACWYRYLWVKLDVEISERGALTLADHPFELRPFLFI